ncbi:Pls/PosA family non-ribosomal peptide synthetase [Pseudonocardia sp. H11422]|uniref:Pls/PosA family non-ribosomal peptide synthetase n=1 Tax=Pseudonocardia sp. H11422 TaxID=2835866 RepID=UPI0027E2283F|nr:Pls/PosA family non-ribosomal peptide synthetase [Pseudonocardia sp. H11422]
MFEFRSDATPDATALVCGAASFTYRELDRASNRLAHRLRESGAGTGRFVALFLDRSELPVIVILACLKSGAAYVPIDPSYPTERIRHILAELGPGLCVTETHLAARASSAFVGTELLILDDDGADREGHPTGRLRRTDTGVCPGDLAYVIYTSGTTGRPKGVMTEHRHVTRFVEVFNEVCATTPGDRVHQGFSLAFDGSVEEIWMAFSNGSTLVVPPRDAPRFGDDLARYLSNEEITYLSTVPTMLSTLGEPPRCLRTVVVSGEVCPAALVSRWARDGLRLLNVYGPTEATVNTTVAECRCDRPVTIGRPLRGYDVTVVDEQLRPVAVGIEGELVISGETLARGYFNRPDLTDERFVCVSGPVRGQSRRLYRTGDLARWNEHGELEFRGRIDGQVKIRGYRVELAEIETVLAEHPHVGAASVRLAERSGLQELAAYVVMADPATEPARDEILELLESRLPPYMVPGHLDVVAEFPRTTSGKIDRKRLPAPVAALVRSSAREVPPEGPLERAIAEVWSNVLGVAVTSVEKDFFLDFAGHSLVAAQMVTALRERISYPVTVRDAYRFPTIRGLAAHVEESADRAGSRPIRAGGTTTPTARAVFDSTPRWCRVAVAAAQAVSLYLTAVPVALPGTVLFLLGLGWVQNRVSTALLLGVVAVLPVMLWPLLLVVSIAAKWLLIGRYETGEHRLGSGFYWRWWLTNRLGALSGAGALVGTPVLPLYYRLMGAKVGPRCTLDTVHCSAWDLVSIGAETSIGSDTQILGYRVEAGMLRLGRIDIGVGCFVGIHSALGLDVRMGDDCVLDDQSLLPDGAVVPSGDGRSGSPAREAVDRLPSAETLGPGRAGRHRPTAGPPPRRALFGLAHVMAVEVMSVVLLAPVLLFAGGYWLAFHLGGPLVGVVAVAASVPFSVIFSGLYIAAVKRVVLTRIRPGTFPVLSARYLRKWLSDALMGTSRALLLPVYTTLYLPPLLRLMGARIGPRAEISTVWSFAPELIDVGPESFFADGSIIGGRRCHRGLCTIGLNRIGRRSFVGNSAILPVGRSLGDNCLLGVQSIPPANQVNVSDGTEWLGSPSFALTHRLKVGNFDTTVTFHPPRRLYLQRALVDGLRILIPAYLGLATLALFFTALYFLYARLGVVAMTALSPIIGFVLALLNVFVVAGLKKVVMGTYRPEIKPLWSMYVWLNEMINGAYESVAAPVLSQLLGTPFVGPLLRMFGCRIGRHTYIATTLFSEFDLVDIGDHAALNHGVVVQNHLFEDRVFKSSRLRIGDGASVGNMSVVLYDSEIEADTVVGPLSLLMKGETLRRGTRWVGVPTVPAAEACDVTTPAHATSTPCRPGCGPGPPGGG